MIPNTKTLLVGIGLAIFIMGALALSYALGVRTSYQKATTYANQVLSEKCTLPSWENYLLPQTSFNTSWLNPKYEIKLNET